MDDWQRFDTDLANLRHHNSASETPSARMAAMTSTRVRPPGPIPSDPGSDEYANYQMRLYERISGRRYEPLRTELATGLSYQDATANPWPYQTRDPSTIGHYLLGVGQILRVIGRCPAHAVLEYGPGWGHTTIAMARSGLEVTAVDVEPMFLRVIQHQAELFNLSIVTHHGTFGDVPDPNATFDVVVFFECFHHCFDHRALIGRLRRKLNPGGRIILCNENIGDVSPYPWGVRMDAHSLWAIRELGWMELGFTEPYIIDLFRSEGLITIKHHLSEAGDAALCYEGALM